jgi:hypothetical protein
VSTGLVPAFERRCFVRLAQVELLAPVQTRVRAILFPEKNNLAKLFIFRRNTAASQAVCSERKCQEQPLRGSAHVAATGNDGEQVEEAEDIAGHKVLTASATVAERRAAAKAAALGRRGRLLLAGRGLSYAVTGG